MTTTQPVFTADVFASFWDNPDPGLVPPELFTEDVVGDWPGASEPVVGREDYMGRIEEVLALVGDLRLAIVESADNGDYVFIQWMLHGVGDHGRFSLPGVDKVGVRDGQVASNLIIFDTDEFERKSGRKLPWMA
jgi:hypothetical protein